MRGKKHDQRSRSHLAMAPGGKPPPLLQGRPRRVPLQLQTPTLAPPVAECVPARPHLP